MTSDEGILDVLIVEDVAADAELALETLRREGLVCRHRRVETEAAMRRALREQLPDFILSDFRLPAFNGAQALDVAVELCPDVPFLFVSGAIGEETAIELLKRGATDYVLKDNLARLVPSVRRALGEAEQRCARRAAEEALRTLARRLVEAEVASQRQLARELHDRIGQNLAALNINLNILRGRLVELTRDDAILSRLDDSLTLNAETIARVRDLLAELRPPVLEDYGLIAALRAFAERFTTRTGIEVTVEGRELVPRPSPAVEAALYRIAQEALTNTAKHARARSARVSVDYLPVLRLTISDDGIGFAAHAMEAGTGAHWGLRNMRERALAVGGELAIESAPGAGTRVTVTLKEAAS